MARRNSQIGLEILAMQQMKSSDEDLVRRIHQDLRDDFDEELSGA